MDRNFLFFLSLFCILLIFMVNDETPEPETITLIETITETEYVEVVELEYIHVNSSEPMIMETTAYTAGPESTGKSPGHPAYGITYTGTVAKHGVCAVDPDYIELGTSMFVEDYGYCRAEDIGGAVKGYHVDVFIADLSEALEFGREQRKVWILEGF